MLKYKLLHLLLGTINLYIGSIIDIQCDANSLTENVSTSLEISLSFKYFFVSIPSNSGCIKSISFINFNSILFLLL